MINGLALCSGGGGLEAGLHLAVKNYRTVCAVERQAYAAAAFVEWMEKTGLGACPVWDDVATFNPLPWRECVDIVSAGFPCQPYSNAGKGLGELDPRDGWPHVIRVVRGIMPTVVFLENVPALLARGYDRVKRNLEGIGYTVAERIVSAAEVGAPHLRERLFILGILDDSACLRWGQGWPEPEKQQGQGESPTMPHSGKALADSGCGPGYKWSDIKRGGAEGGAASCRASHMGNANGNGSSGCVLGEREQNAPTRAVAGPCLRTILGNSESQPERAGLCPERQEGFGRGRYGDTGCEEFSNPKSKGLEIREKRSCGHEEQSRPQHGCLSTFDWPWPAGRGAEQYAWEKPRIVESGMGGTTHGVGARNEQLLMLGNGVVPVAAAMAFVSLWEQLKRGA